MPEAPRYRQVADSKPRGHRTHQPGFVVRSFSNSRSTRLFSRRRCRGRSPQSKLNTEATARQIPTTKPMGRLGLYTNRAIAGMAKSSATIATTKSILGLADCSVTSRILSSMAARLLGVVIRRSRSLRGFECRRRRKRFQFAQYGGTRECHYTAAPLMLQQELQLPSNESLGS